MKVFAIILNVGVLVFVAFMCIYEGVPEGDEIILLIPLFGIPLVNLWVIGFRRKGDSWLGLYLKRKALEEQEKIEALSEDKGK